MKKVIRITESQLNNVVKKVIAEQMPENQPQIPAELLKCFAPIEELGFNECKPAIEEAKKDPKKVNIAIGCISKRINIFDPAQAGKITAAVAQVGTCILENSRIKPKSPMPEKNPMPTGKFPEF